MRSGGECAILDSEYNGRRRIVHPQWRASVPGPGPNSACKAQRVRAAFMRVSPHRLQWCLAPHGTPGSVGETTPPRLATPRGSVGRTQTQCASTVVGVVTTIRRARTWSVLGPFSARIRGPRRHTDTDRTGFVGMKTTSRPLCVPKSLTAAVATGRRRPLTAQDATSRCRARSISGVSHGHRRRQP
jgi:hypothetical protein